MLMAEEQLNKVTNYLARLRDPVTHRFHSVTAREFLECWQHYDRDGNGYLEGEELDGFLREFISSVIPGDIGNEVVSDIAMTQLKTEFMNAYDDNSDGRIDINELARILPTDETFLALFQHEAPLSTSVEFMRVWKQFDADNSGYIEKEELRGFLKHLLVQSKINVSDEKLDDYTNTLLILFDRDGDGRLQLNEMARLLPVKENYLVKPLFRNTKDITERTIDRIFRKYDTDGNGKLENEELMGFLKDLLEAGGGELSEDRMLQMKNSILSQWDADHDGKIGKQELTDLILQTVRIAQETEALNRSKDH
ncbi:Calbindin [Paragonimus heterotremus]|uniref:Calbindin n=1 Tax=Paragonimus heterotremus TaxID=100268 RepID=A0A8J4SWM1_9TREM|nr:Calbindin [Paragonimus heterotremus]